MCLIIASRNGSTVTDSELLKAYRDNPDGWGVMWHNGSKLETRKGFSAQSLLKAQAAAKGFPYVTHLRWATHGAVNVENCHPFKINKRLWMAHNGVISSVRIERPDRSDTWHLAKLLEKTEPDDLYRKTFQGELAKFIGGGNKLAFLDANATITLINESCGKWMKDIWLSNTHSIGRPKYEPNYRPDVGRRAIGGMWADIEYENWTRDEWIAWANGSYDEADSEVSDSAWWRQEYYSDTGDCIECGSPGEVYVDPETGRGYCEFCLELFDYETRLARMHAMS